MIIFILYMKKLKLRWNDLCNMILPIMLEARFRPRFINSLNNWNSTQFILTSLNWFCSLKADWWLIHPLSYFTETALHMCHLCPPSALLPSLTTPHRTKGSGHDGNFNTGTLRSKGSPVQEDPVLKLLTINGQFLKPTPPVFLNTCSLQLLKTHWL